MSGSALDDVFAALAHPARRELIRRMARAGEATVGDLAAGFDVSLNQVSKHLKILERAGLLRRRRVGREHRCRLDPRPLLGARTWLEAYETFWGESLEALERYLETTHPGEEEEGKDD